MIDIKTLGKICETPGAPGFEQRIRQLVIGLVTPLVDDVQIDNMGNVFAIKKGKEDKRVMVAAHMDEIGFVVSHIDEKGFVRFQTLGGFDPKTLTAQRVIIHGKKRCDRRHGKQAYSYHEAGRKEQSSSYFRLLH